MSQPESVFGKRVRRIGVLRDRISDNLSGEGYADAE